MSRLLASLLLACATIVGARAPGTKNQEPGTNSVRDAILSAEDRRAPDAAALGVLTGALHDLDPAVQRLAVRALGRLERPALVPTLAPMLASADPATRAEAANALAQSVSPLRAAGSAPPKLVSAVAQVESLVAAQLAREAQPAVRGVLCESLGRLPYRTAAELQAVEKLLVTCTFSPASEMNPSQDADLQTLSGAVKGLESLLRQNAKVFTPSPSTIDRLRTLVRARGQTIRLKPDPTGQGARLRLDPTGEDDAARVRRLALLALAARSAADSTTLAAAMGDGDWEVRRIAARSAGGGLRGADGEDRTTRMALVMRGLADAHWRVRYEALSAFGRNQDALECRVILTAAADPSPHVSLLAVDLASRCAAGLDAPRILGGMVRLLPSSDGAWHRPAHAVVSLARLVPEQALAQLPRFVSSTIWQVRVYAARAATIAKAGDVLRTLAADENDNVRAAAVNGLSEVEQHAADEVFINQLARGDGQLLMDAARALKGTPDRARALPALTQALATLTSRHRDTSRDVRLALLDRIGDVGSREQADTVEQYVRDFDPRVARAAAAIVKQWTGIDRALPRSAAPSSPPPTFEQVRQLDGAKAVVRMKNGGTFTLALLTSDASATSVRFARLARAGYYNGLTFHRVEPASLIQGGSPGANEYDGDGPFMRDELGFASNRRGSVGLSTRGRDTGDAQWYINLVDNVRYDHTYTVFALVESGMDVVDAIQEGDVIEEVRIITNT